MTFKKEELLSLHGLLYQTIEYLEEDPNVEIERYEEYEKLGIGPNYAHKSKEDHEEAIQTLSEIITESLSEEPSQYEPEVILEESP